MRRYAIYFVPAADSALWDFGRTCIGYDSYTGADVAFHGHAFYQHENIRAWTADPRRYGFHATLKSPFALAPGTTVGELDEAAEKFASGQGAVVVEALKVAAIGGFLALVPAGPSRDLDALAADCVRAFERFRAPLSDTDRARRLQSALTAKQIELLDRWGYPYVFEEFRFHMTLTGRLSDDIRAAGLAALRDLYAPLAAPLQCDAIAVCEQVDRNARFRVRRRFALAS